MDPKEVLIESEAMDRDERIAYGCATIEDEIDWYFQECMERDD